VSESSRLDPAMLEELRGVFRGEAHERVGVLRKILGELAAKTGDADGLLKQARREAHNLKGSAATVEANEAQGLALRLEKQLDVLSGGGVFPSTIAVMALRAITEEFARVVQAPPP
jgi:chemotaxis protein histidine kinase CheA